MKKTIAGSEDVEICSDVNTPLVPFSDLRQQIIFTGGPEKRVRENEKLRPGFAGDGSELAG